MGRRHLRLCWSARVEHRVLSADLRSRDAQQERQAALWMSLNPINNGESQWHQKLES